MIAAHQNAEDEEGQRLNAYGDEDRGPALEGVCIEPAGDKGAQQCGADHEPDEHWQGTRLAGTGRRLRVDGLRGGHAATVDAIDNGCSFGLILK